jgi:hypothetical protein
MLQLLLFAAAAIAVQDGVTPSPREERVKKFVNAFFNEDEKSLLPLTSGRLKKDLENYFWIRRSIHGEKAAPRAWSGEIKILRSAHGKVLNTEAEIHEEDAELFELRVDGKAYQLGMDDRNAVILFRDGAK